MSDKAQEQQVQRNIEMKKKTYEAEMFTVMTKNKPQTRGSVTSCLFELSTGLSLPSTKSEWTFI